MAFAGHRTEIGLLSVIDKKKFLQINLKELISLTEESGKGPITKEATWMANVLRKDI